VFCILPSFPGFRSLHTFIFSKLPFSPSCRSHQAAVLSKLSFSPSFRFLKLSLSPNLRHQLRGTGEEVKYGFSQTTVPAKKQNVLAQVDVIFITNWHCLMSWATVNLPCAVEPFQPVL
jgi:hypothetical protein